MLQKEIYKNAPRNYVHCMNDKCPLAKSCLRALAWNALRDDILQVLVLNPSKTEKGEQCPYYRESDPMKFATGLTGMLSKMYPAQYKSFTSELISLLGRTTYYKCRNGERFLKPEEQALVQRALRYSGADIPLQFDKYKDDVLW